MYFQILKYDNFKIKFKVDQRANVFTTFYLSIESPGARRNDIGNGADCNYESCVHLAF